MHSRQFLLIPKSRPQIFSIEMKEDILY